MSIDHHRLHCVHQIPEQFFAAVRAIVHDHRAQPLVIGVVESDLAGPFVVSEEFLIALRQLRCLDQVGVVGGRIIVRIDAVPAAGSGAPLRQKGGPPPRGANRKTTPPRARFPLGVAPRPPPPPPPPFSFAPPRGG